MMTILKWYSVILFSFAIVLALFKNGKSGAGFLGTFVGLLIELPILLYLILS